MAQFTFDAIGTRWAIDIYDPIAVNEEAALLSGIKARIDLFDKAYSRFRADSLVTEMSKKAGTYRLPDDAAPMMNVYRDLYVRTDGSMTPLIGNLISDAGYDAEYSLKQKGPLKTPLTWEEAIEYKEPDLIVNKPVMLDFGAAGKGYLVDLVAEVIEAAGVKRYCVDAGGDILHKDDKPMRVGLEDPHDATKVVGVCELQNSSMCGSAGNRRVWGDFTHIMDPRTLSSPRKVSAIWTVASSVLVADALATALFFVPAAKLIPAYAFEYLIVNADRSFERSAGFPGELFV